MAIAEVKKRHSWSGRRGRGRREYTQPTIIETQCGGSHQSIRLFRSFAVSVCVCKTAAGFSLGFICSYSVVVVVFILAGFLYFPKYPYHNLSTISKGYPSYCTSTLTKHTKQQKTPPASPCLPDQIATSSKLLSRARRCSLSNQN